MQFLDDFLDFVKETTPAEDCTMVFEFREGAREITVAQDREGKFAFLPRKELRRHE